MNYNRYRKRLRRYLDGWRFYPAELPRTLRYGGIAYGLALTFYRLTGHLLWPIKDNKLGTITTAHEFINCVDNFCNGELRCDVVENHLRLTAQPTVVDLGINIGLTARWWFGLNPKTKVFGIDMIAEALEFTGKKLHGISDPENWIPIESAIGNTDEFVEIKFDDPLAGTNKIDFSAEHNGSTARRVHIRTLDAVLSDANIKTIDVLKVDIEGAGGLALCGAQNTLSKCIYCITEVHGSDELRMMGRVMATVGMIPFHIKGRTVYWERDNKSV